MASGEWRASVRRRNGYGYDYGDSDSDSDSDSEGTAATTHTAHRVTHHDRQRCSARDQPQRWEEPAGATLGDG